MFHKGKLPNPINYKAECVGMEPSARCVKEQRGGFKCYTVYVNDVARKCERTAAMAWENLYYTLIAGKEAALTK